jgi:hypothetical protein
MSDECQSHVLALLQTPSLTDFLHTMIVLIYQSLPILTNVHLPTLTLKKECSQVTETNTKNAASCAGVEGRSVAFLNGKEHVRSQPVCAIDHHISHTACPHSRIHDRKLLPPLHTQSRAQPASESPKPPSLSQHHGPQTARSQHRTL